MKSISEKKRRKVQFNPIQKAKIWLKTTYAEDSIQDQKKLESLFFGNIVFGILGVIYFLSQITPDMSANYWVYLMGHFIVSFGLLSSFFCLMLKKKYIAVWLLYLMFIGTTIATLMVPSLEEGDYYFYMFNYTFAQSTFLMYYLYINIVSIQKIHKKASILVTLSVSLLSITYYALVVGDTTQILSVLLIVFVAFFINALVISTLHHSQIKELKQNQIRIENLLETSEERVRKLEKILPICSNCKKIRQEDNTWVQLEQYFWDETEVKFSHGLCNQCAKELYGDFFDS